MSLEIHVAGDGHELTVSYVHFRLVSFLTILNLSCHLQARHQSCPFPCFYTGHTPTGYCAMHLAVVFARGVEIVRMAPEAPPVLHLTAAHHRLRSLEYNTKVRHTKLALQIGELRLANFSVKRVLWWL
jgi:hypothetical protein